MRKALVRFWSTDPGLSALLMALVVSIFRARRSVRVEDVDLLKG